MSYYVIIKATGLIATDGPNRTRSYNTFGAAKATRTRLCNKSGWGINELDIVDTKTYQPRMVTRKNLMSGAEFQEDVNTLREHALLLLALERNFLEHVI